MCFKIRRKRQPRNGARGSPPREHSGAELSGIRPAPSASRTSLSSRQQVTHATPPSDPHMTVGLRTTAPEQTISAISSPLPDTGIGWKMSTWNATKLALDVVREGSDSLPALKSVAGGLAAVIRHSERTAENQDSIRKLAKRIENISVMMKTYGASQDPFDEASRRDSLTRKLEEFSPRLTSMQQASVLKRFANNVQDDQAIREIVEDIRDALTTYQVSLQQDLLFANRQLIESDHINTLEKLPHAKRGGFRSDDRSSCLKGTRVDLLDELDDWAASADTLPIYWLNGIPGTGKTTISQSLADRLVAESRLGACIFFSREDEERSSIRLVFTTIAVDLAYHLPEFRMLLVEAIKSNPRIGYSTLDDQVRRLLVHPLRAIKKLPELPIIIIIDALDECTDPSPESTILSLLSEHFKNVTFVKFFITSRPEAHIRSVFNRPLKFMTKELALHDMDRDVVDRDIKLYLMTHLGITADRSDNSLAPPWPSEDEINVMVEKCDGLFIYASTTIRFVTSHEHNPRQRLKSVIGTKRGRVDEIGSRIDPLYMKVLEVSYLRIDSGDRSGFFDRLRAVVACILMLLEPLSCKQLAQLLNVGTSTIIKTLRPLNSVLFFPSDLSRAIKKFHKSFPDFLTDSQRCTDSNFYLDPRVHHGKIALNCLELMQKQLSRNIVEIPRYEVNEGVEDLVSRRKGVIGDTLEYACRYWARHLCLASTEGDGVAGLARALREFLKHRFTFWIEILSVSRVLNVAVYAFQDLRQWIFHAKNIHPETSQLVYDCERLVVQFFDVISESAPHMYHSALPWSPAKSALRRNYQNCFAGEVKINGVPDYWSRLIRTIPVEGVTSVAFSYDGRLIAASVDGKTNVGGSSYLFDTATGDCRATLTAPGPAKYIAFSSDDTVLMSLHNLPGSSKNSAICLWDVQTGAQIQSISCSRLFAVTFSPNGEAIASGGDERVVQVLDVVTGECIQTLEGHSNRITSIAYSHDASHIISTSWDKTIKLWDAHTDVCLRTHATDTSLLFAAYSPDNHHIATIASDKTIRLHAAETLDMLHSFQNQDRIERLCFNPSSNGVVFAAQGHLLTWEYLGEDATPKRRIQTHTNPDSLSISPDGSRIASSSGSTIQIWSTVAEGETSSGVSAPMRCKNLFFSEDGQLIAACYETRERRRTSSVVEIWDAVNATRLHSLSVPHQVDSFTASRDRTMLALGACEYSVKIYNNITGSLIKESSVPLANHKILSFQFSPDGSRIMVAGIRGRVAIWDVETGALLLSSDTKIPENNTRMSFSTEGDGVVWEDNSKVYLWNITATHPPLSSTKPLELVPSIKTPEHISRTAVTQRYQLAENWISDDRGRKIFRVPASFEMRLHQFEEAGVVKARVAGVGEDRQLATFELGGMDV